MGIFDFLFAPQRTVPPELQKLPSPQKDLSVKLTPDPVGMEALRENHRLRMGEYASARARNEKERRQEYEERRRRQEARSQQMEQERSRQRLDMQQATATLMGQILEVIEKHKSQLGMRYRLSAKDDGYGNISREGWARETQYFIDKVLNRDLGPRVDSIDKFWLDDEITKAASEVLEEERTVEELTPLEFEDYCYIQLRAEGWSISKTPTSGDQGVDLLAEKGGFRLAVQCKLYSSAVGNFAVQEVYAGMRHFNCNRAAVVTNNRYTPQAEQLARSTKVLLLHVSELRDIEKRL